jgi:hypothetical protein
MSHLHAIAGAILLALISAATGADMERCMERASFNVCHYALNR